MRKHAPIALVLVIAAAVRFWAIDFGLPSPLCRPDEEAVAGIAILVFGRHYNPDFFNWPTLFMYAVTLSMVPLFKIGRWVGWFRSEYHFLQVISTDWALVLMHARVISAVMGVASVWFLYRIARRLFDETAALIAALLLALAYLHARDSHFGVTDVTATALLLASFLFVVRLRESGRWRDILAAAVFAGLATSTKYNAALIAMPALWVIVTAPSRTSSRVAARLARCAAFGAIMLTAFALTSPYCLIEFRKFWAALTYEAAHLAAGHGILLDRGWVVHLGVSLRYGIGIPMLAGGLAGLAWLLCRQPRKGFLVVLFPVIYYAIIGSGYTVFARYILPVVPFLCLAAAFAAREASIWIATRVGRPAWSAPTAWVVALVVVSPSAWSIVQFDRLAARTDSRVLAARWIETRFPGGARVAQAGPQFTHLYFRPTGIGAPSLFTSAALAADTAEPDILVVATSPLEPDRVLPANAAALAARYQLRHAVAAFEEGANASVYDRQDEFYLPLAGFTGIRRPGPNLAVYVRPGFVWPGAPAPPPR